jgi:hypothetical protein
MKMIRFIIGIIVGGCFLFQSVSAQNTIIGKVQESNSLLPLPGAGVVLLHSSDSTLVASVITNDTGNFVLSGISNGHYILRVTFIGYTAFYKQLQVNGTDVFLGALQLQSSDRLLKDVNVVEYQARAEQKGDTTQYNANAFKTQPDATAEDLVTKMPGITSENGTLKAHGQEVKKVMVDGKPFFGDDVNAAMKNLPADVIDKVQVYQGMSDQSAFTGFDDGNSQQTLNIVTKDSKRNGVFGKVYGGAGYLTDLRYNTGLNLNWFRNNMRLSVIFMANNINQQNFSFQDILGVTNTQTPQFAGMFGGGPPPGAPKGPPPAAAGGPGASISNFLTTQQEGLASTYATGLNYSDVWGKKQKVNVTGSYFFNYADNENTSKLTRKYYSQTDTALYYNEQGTKSSINVNHRANMRIQYAIDSNNSLIITPAFTYQNSKQKSNTVALNSYNMAELLSNVNTTTSLQNTGYNVSTDVLYRHKFSKQGRTFSIGINGKYNEANLQYGLNTLVVSPPADSAITNQQTTTVNSGYTFGGNVNYTEPVGKFSTLQFNYTHSATWSNADKTTLIPDNTEEYTVVDSALTNTFSSKYYTQKVGVAYMFRKNKVSLNTGWDIQYASLSGKESFPTHSTLQKSFFTFLPNARFSYNFSNATSLRVMYRSSTTAPSVNQLQNVIDNSNPTQLTIGNPGLAQSFTHSAIIDFRHSAPKRGQTLFGMVNINYTGNYIGKSQYTVLADTILLSTIAVAGGSQITTPVNLKNYWTVNGFVAYGIPIAKIKSNLNFNTGLNLSSTPGLINGILNTTNTYAVNAGLFLSSNISEKIDFSVNYFSTHNIVQNTLQTTANNNYFTHNATAKVNWLFWKGFVMGTSLQNTLYSGISGGYNQNIFLWNASLGYKFLKDKSLEVKASVNDILNQNTGITRNVTETYVEDSQNTVLKRYLLVSVTYNLKYFNSKQR